VEGAALPWGKGLGGQEGLGAQALLCRRGQGSNFEPACLLEHTCRVPLPAAALKLA
jgi:hypothetical protein